LRSILANDDERDQSTGGSGNDGKIGESESVERVPVGENNLCTGDREHDDWDDDQISPSYKLQKQKKKRFINGKRSRTSFTAMLEQ